jgi:hypothetical protein
MFTNEEKRIGGCKLTLKMLQNRLEKVGVDWKAIWYQIE